ncbi:hypothetical protein ACFQMF_10775 [Halorubrum rutilum]|uniref:Outer membrane lipoprotein-sorting protein n=1 Tax=Halorubrum rutilum TaxID=1364933 RepID=A0ABD6AMA7_9EURY|nr:hypothetical protein [Halorubrum rutilum]
MSRRISAAIAVVFLLALAGCGGVAFDDHARTTDPSATDPTSNATAVPNEALADAEFPEGFSRSEIEIATARRQSIAFLRTEPVSGVALERFRPGAYADYQYEASATRARFRLDVHNGYADVSQSDVYVESNVRHSRSGRNGQAAFEATNGSVDETRFRAADSMWAVVSRILTIGEFRAVRVTENAGERRIRYAITDVAVRNATDVRGYLTVGEDGVVREAQLLYDQGGEPKRFQYSVTSRSASGVAPPAWLPAARANSRFEPGSEANGGSTVDATNDSR